MSNSQEPDRTDLGLTSQGEGHASYQPSTLCAIGKRRGPFLLTLRTYTSLRHNGLPYFGLFFGEAIFNTIMNPTTMQGFDRGPQGSGCLSRGLRRQRRTRTRHYHCLRSLSLRLRRKPQPSSVLIFSTLKKKTSMRSLDRGSDHHQGEAGRSSNVRHHPDIEILTIVRHYFVRISWEFKPAPWCRSFPPSVIELFDVLRLFEFLVTTPKGSIWTIFFNCILIVTDPGYSLVASQC